MSKSSPRQEMDYTYTGYIMVHREYAGDRNADEYIILRAYEAAAPIMLSVRGNLREYIRALLTCGYQERRMTKRWHYDVFCELWQVDVLDDNGDVVKTVRQGQAWRPFVGEGPEGKDKERG